MRIDMVAPTQEPNPENLDLPRWPPTPVSLKKNAAGASAPSRSLTPRNHQIRSRAHKIQSWKSQIRSDDAVDRRIC